MPEMWPVLAGVTIEKLEFQDAGRTFATRLMDTMDIVEGTLGGIFFLCLMVSMALSLWNFLRKLPPIDRYPPLALQLFIFVFGFIPSPHGTPSELFGPTILLYLWAAFLTANSYRL
jgi:hypothetical protein